MSDFFYEINSFVCGQGKPQKYKTRENEMYVVEQRILGCWKG